MKIVILGGGSIGEAFARCIVQKKITSPSDLLIVEVNPEKAAKLKSALKCSVSSDSSEIAAYDFIIMAVKPQDFASLAAQIVTQCKPEQVFISVMAGVPLAKIGASLGGVNKLIRCMPNLPVVKGEGTIAFVPSKEVNYDELIQCERILGSGGTVVRLDSEELLDPVTAISGSGPGYLYYALERLMEVSAELGLSEETARALIFSTIRGALGLAENEPHSLTTLRAAVTSKGGTTQAAIECFEEHKLGEALKEGVRRACRRAKELAS